VDARFQEGENVPQISQNEAAETFLIEKDIAVTSETTDTFEVGGLDCLFAIAGDEVLVARGLGTWSVDVNPDLVKDGQIGFPLRVGALTELLAGDAGVDVELGEEIGMPGQQRIHRGIGRHIAEAVADDVDHGGAVFEIRIDFLERGLAECAEPFLRCDIDAPAFEVAGEQPAVALEFAADG